MAPVPSEEDTNTPDLSVSSLELDVRAPDPIPTTLLLHTRGETSTLSVIPSDLSFKLVDTEGKTGFWFVLQDLSVRTEGFFRYVKPTS